MSRYMPILVRAALLLVPLLIGAAILMRAASSRVEPEPVSQTEPASAVRVVTMEPVAFVPQVSAFGTVEPASTWRALAQVSGVVEELLPDLQPGRLVDAGTRIIRIDAADYELAEAQAIARLAAAEARLAEFGTREENFAASLEIERRALELAEAELERRRALLASGTGSQATVDQAEEGVLQRRARVQDIDNQLRLLPAQAGVQEAEKRIAESQLAEARRNIERTVVAMPFEGRISEVSVERGQFVTGGQVMVVAEDLALAEVSARLTPQQLEPLIADRLAHIPAFELTAANIDAIPQAYGLSVELRLDIGSRVFVWPAGIRRLSFAIDPQTRTVGLVVGVKEPYRLAIPGERPPLMGGMFVEVVLRGAAREDALLVPREALERDGEGWAVHVADGEDRLRRRPVALGGLFGNVALVAEGLAAGDRVVVGELGVAVEGMLLSPREDEALKRRLGGEGAEAPGEGPEEGQGQAPETEAAP